MRVIALIDGEHYPAVTRWGLDVARAAGCDVVAALFVGGAEKLDATGSLGFLGRLPVSTRHSDRDVVDAIDRYHAEGILDLSGEPVLEDEARVRMAAIALSRGLSYLGPDFRFDPPITEPAVAAPTLAVIGTGKRVGKTALGGHLARLAVAAGRRPMIVAMGRGGPEEPTLAGPDDVRLEALLRRVERGEHAASDYLEDAATSGVTTVGARRCGAGLAGRPYATNVRAAAERAVGAGAGLVILEGSGASLPTLRWDAGVLVLPSALRPHVLAGYLGPVRVLLSDLAVFIIDGGQPAGPENLFTLDSLVRRLRADIRVAVAELVPVPLADVRGKDAFFATTAAPEVARHVRDRLERDAGCRVVKVSSHLGDRAKLEDDLRSAPHFDVLLTELKAAAVDVASRFAVKRGADVVFVDNRPVGVGGDGPLDELLLDTIDAAVARAAERCDGAERAR